MDKNWISYQDSEVSVYHPICHSALKTALKELKLDKNYIVKHHEYTGSLEMDFVIKNKKTNKYLCVIEVKKQPEDVFSTRYQFQTMSYVQMNSHLNEKPFYILTNLENALSFRYDPSLPKSFQQVLKPGLHKIGNFIEHSKEEHLEKLTLFFKKQISFFVKNEYEYLLTLDHFYEHLYTIRDRQSQWEVDLVFLMYEYIRGAFYTVNRKDLRDIRIFKRNTENICSFAKNINFIPIFEIPNKYLETPTLVEERLLSEMFELGKSNVDGNSIANVIHQIVSSGREHEGEVPTDLELARILSVLAKYVAQEDFKEDDKLCDPAAGSGNLISAGIQVFNIGPQQVIANDINARLLELLSLRIGLSFVDIIGKNNSPTITNKDISDLDPDHFRKVKVTLLNPPFVSGINSMDRKSKMFKKIKKLTLKSRAKTEVGQMPLEGVFLELLSHLLPKGSIIACILPQTHLTARGREARIIRELLLDDLGMELMFHYPGTGIFENVMKDTFIFVGKIGEKNKEVEIISTYTNISDIDVDGFYHSLFKDKKEHFDMLIPGIEAKRIPRKKLREELPLGWRSSNSETTIAFEFVKNNFEYHKQMLTLDDYITEENITFRRGTAGNAGASDLLFIDSRKDMMDYSRHLEINSTVAIRRAESDLLMISEDANAKFLDYFINEESKIDKIIEKYISEPTTKGKQTRKKKSKEELNSLLKRESRKYFVPFSVLIPRNIRRKGRVYLAQEKTFISTNFVVISELKKREAFLLSTWISTVMYQLICEMHSKDQDGTRKMEVQDIRNTFIPNFELVSDEQYYNLKKQAESSDFEFVDLKNPVIRETDKIWGRILFGEKAEEILSETTELLKHLTNLRDS